MQRLFCKSTRALGGLAILAILAGCSDLPFFKSTHYAIEGLSGSTRASDDANAYLKSRVATIVKAKDAKAQADQEVYQEKTIQADLVKTMQSDGYYDAKVDFKKGGKPWSGSFLVQPGRQYTIQDARILPAQYAYFLRDDPAIRRGAKLLAAPVLDIQQKIYTAIQKNQCYFNLSVTNAVVLDRRAKTAVITFNVAAGPHAKFGAVDFTGSDTVKKSYLYSLIPWKRGGCFNREDIESYRTKLFESGLFSRVDTVLPATPQPDGEVPIGFRLKDRDARTITAGLNYYTDQGFGVTLGWKHRNLLGAAETLDTTLTLSQLQQELSANFTKPYFMQRKDQSLNINADIDHQDTDAYKKSGIDGGVSVSRKLNKYLTFTTGVGLGIDRIDDKTKDDYEDYALLSFPQTLAWDSRDSTLDPHKGWFISGTVSPFVDLFGQSDPFWKTVGQASTYLPVYGETILALRGKVGSILGSGTATIPATERFYAGGGGSVRGFGYQDIGPQKNGNPLGGRSVTEASAELRFKLTDKFGMVTFLDAGSVGSEIAPVLDNLSVGAGAGVRYYTSFGPLRFDVATPLNNRTGTDRRVEFYISIGQAF